MYRVDYFGTVVAPLPGEVPAIAHMHMTMEQILGAVCIQQLPQGTKSGMGRVRSIAHTLRGRMGHHDIHTAASAKLPAKPVNPAAHLLFRILVRPIPVPQTSSQSQDPDTIIDQNLVFDTQTPFRRIQGITAIMVAMNVQQRAMGHRYQKL